MYLTVPEASEATKLDQAPTSIDFHSFSSQCLCRREEKKRSIPHARVMQDRDCYYQIWNFTNKDDELKLAPALNDSPERPRLEHWNS